MMDPWKRFLKNSSATVKGSRVGFFIRQVARNPDSVA
jgi:hypothetical protein